MPLISIITPVYNASASIGKVIQSVQAQLFTDWEMVIVDDCSDDGTGAVVERFNADDPRIRLIRRAENGGAAKATNHALSVAKGDYIAFLNADDLWLPEKLGQQLHFMQEIQASVSYHGFRRNTAAKWQSRFVRGPLRVTFETLQRQFCVALSTMMIHRVRISNFHFTENTNLHEDLTLLLELTKAGHDIVLINQDLARISASPRTWIQTAYVMWHTYRQVTNLSKRQSFVALCCVGVSSLWKRVF
jgi:teichuronic acid biosynthesis glycosyltransferase TuaG